MRISIKNTPGFAPGIMEKYDLLRKSGRRMAPTESVEDNVKQSVMDGRGRRMMRIEASRWTRG
jgi:hypothetical protein